MKAKEFKPLRSWEEREPVLQDQLFYIPTYYPAYEKFSLPAWRELFGNELPIAIEYCSGNGSWLIEKALVEPQFNWVGVEKRFDRVRKIYAKAKNRNIENLLVVWGEALTFSRYYIPSNSVDKLFINFPDPWPKNSAAKHRLLAPDFLNELHRIMKKEATLTFVTDDTSYHEKSCALFIKSSLFTSCFPEPFYTHEMPGYGTSFFETLWREKGKSIYYQQWKKRCPSL